MALATIYLHIQTISHEPEPFRVHSTAIKPIIFIC